MFARNNYPNSNTYNFSSEPNNSQNIQPINETWSKVEDSESKPANSNQTTHINSKIISNCYKGGEHTINVNDLSSEKLMELMDYWWKNEGM